MDTCNFCIFPAVGICPNCGKLYCPDHVQMERPFLLCSECEQHIPNYYENWGEMTRHGTWIDYRSGNEYPTPETRFNIKINSAVDLWGPLEGFFEEQGSNLWEIYENTYRDMGNQSGVIVAQLRKQGLYTPQQVYQAVDNFGAQKQFDQALALMNDSLLLMPDDPELLLRRGMIAAEIKDFNQALDDYSKLIHLFPEHPLAYEKRVVIRVMMGSYDEDQMLKDLATVERLGATNSPTHFFRGLIYARQVVLFGQKMNAPLAEKELSISINENPENHTAIQLRGFVRMLTGRNAEAAADFEKVSQFMGRSFTDLEYLF